MRRNTTILRPTSTGRATPAWTSAASSLVSVRLSRTNTRYPRAVDDRPDRGDEHRQDDERSQTEPCGVAQCLEGEHAGRQERELLERRDFAPGAAEEPHAGEHEQVDRRGGGREGRRRPLGDEM